MNKIKKLTWFAAFCSLLQYTRERKFAAYLFANGFNCVIPAVLLVLFLGGHISWVFCIGINLLARLIFAPVDAYTSGEYAFGKLETYPLNIFEKLYVRLFAKVIQISEWAFAAAVAYVYCTVFSGVEAVVLTLVTLLAMEISEEVVFYLVYLVKNQKKWVGIFLAVCVALGVLLVLWKNVAVVSAGWAIGFFGTVLALSLAVVLVLHLNRWKIHVLPRLGGTDRNARIPLSTRVVMGAAGGSVLKRMVRLEWVTMLKLKAWDVLSALGYLLIFSVIDQSANYVYLMVQYFIVDYCFLAGFNYFGNTDDRSGMFLFSTIDTKTLLRSKNLALSSVLLVISTALSLVLSVVRGQGVKAVVLTLVANVFCTAVMVLCSSVLSVKHFHLSTSRKKYTVSNMVIMLLILVVNSILTEMLFVGGVLAAVSLIFMAATTMASLYFALVDTSLLEKLFANNREKMVAALRN